MKKKMYECMLDRRSQRKRELFSSPWSLVNGHCMPGTLPSSLHVPSHSTHPPGRDTEVQDGRVMRKGHVGGKRDRQDLNSELILLMFHCTALWILEGDIPHELCHEGT